MINMNEYIVKYTAYGCVFNEIKKHESFKRCFESLINEYHIDEILSIIKK